MMFLSGSAQDGARRLCASWLPAMGGSGGSMWFLIFHKQDHLWRGPKEQCEPCSSCRVGESSFNLTSKVFVAWDNVPFQKPRQVPPYCKSGGRIRRQNLFLVPVELFEPRSLIPKFISPRSQETSIKDGSVHLSFAVRMGMGHGRGSNLQSASAIHSQHQVWGCQWLW